MKHKLARPHSTKGYVLIEALIAMLVVAIGTFGLMRTNVVLLAGSGDSKVRSQAVQLTQWQVESLREQSRDGACPVVGDSQMVASASMQAGQPQLFRIETRVTASSSASRVNTEVCTTWSDNTSVSACNAAASERVRVFTTISCTGTGATGLASGKGMANLAGFVRTPTGAARVGGTTYDANSLPGSDADKNSVLIGGVKVGDGTRSVFNEAADRWELIEEFTGRVLLTIDNATADDKFSTITGRVLIEAQNNGNPIVNPIGTDATSILDDNVFILSSDASICTRIFNNSGTEILPSGATGSGIKYRVFYYQCYVGKGWWGNIGVVRLDNANVNDRVCVGDPTYNNDNTLWSRHAQLSSSRAYRAYRLISSNPDKYTTTGIGISNNANETYTAVNIGTNIAGTGLHDFLITNITGSNASCLNSGKMQLINPSPFFGNQGKYYCMSGQCPNLSSNPTIPQTIISGSITGLNPATDIFTVTGIDTNNVTCIVDTKTFAANGSSFSCELNWEGTANTSWQGILNFGLSGTASLCPTGLTATATPSSNTIAVSVNDRNANPNPNSLRFTDIPVSVTAININVKAAISASACGSLGQPSPSWGSSVTTVQNGPATLSWPGIASAQSYKIYTCSGTYAAQPCTPNALTTTISTTSYVPVAPGNGDMRCIGIVASGTGFTDSPMSPTKCVRRDNNSFYHY